MGDLMSPDDYTQDSIEGAVNGTSDIPGHAGEHSTSGTFGITREMQSATQASRQVGAAKAPGAKSIRWGWWLGGAAVSLMLWGAVALVLIR